MLEYSLLIDNTGNKKEINSLFLFNLYYYYHNKGYSNLLLTELTNLLILIYTVFIIIFSVQCVNFKGLINYNTKEIIQLKDYIKINNFWEFNPFIIICIVLFTGYILIRLISVYASVKKFWKIRKIYNEELEISDSDIQHLSWNEISNKIIKFYCNPNLNSYTMALKIMTKENLIISVYDELDNLDFHKYPLTKLLEWNFIFCFINPLINENREIDNDIKMNKDKYIKQALSNIKKVTIINILFLPFLLIFMLLYMILQYGEQFYNNPKLIVNRQWSIKSSWKIRYYNELPHLFYNRIEKGGQAVKEYDKQFPSKISETISQFLAFMIGSLFLILVILSFLNENLLINLNITNNRPILWYMGIFGGILTLTKAFINKTILFDPEKYLKKVTEYIDLDDEWTKKPKDKSVRNGLLKLFPQRVILLLEECYCLLLTPYILWFVLRKETHLICNYLINNLEIHHSVNGLIHKNSLFINYSQIQNHKKTHKSLENFKKNTPEYELSHFLYNQETYYDSNSNSNSNGNVNVNSNTFNNTNSNVQSPLGTTINETPENTIGILIKI